MEPVAQVRQGAAVWDVAVPPRSAGMAGVGMAGFRGRAHGTVDLPVVPYPALTVFLDFGDGELADDTTGLRKKGVVVGLAPGNVRGRGRTIDCLQIRLSPVTAHEVLGRFPELGGTVAGLDELWGRAAVPLREQPHAAASWHDRFTLARDMLTRRRETGRPVDPEIAFAWQRMTTSRGQICIEQLAAEAGGSRKRPWSRFRTQTGLTPPNTPPS